MTEKIQFIKHTQQSTFYNPMMGNKLDTQVLEVRQDPLTGAQSVFNPRLEDKVVMFYGKSDTALIEKMAQASQAICFLCGDNWKKMTPEYPENLVPEGRIQSGQAVLFPNIFPAAQVHAVIRVGDRHYVPLEEFDTTAVADAFDVSLDMSRRLASASDMAVKYMTINGNYLGPAGASIAHPHFQLVGGDMPFTYLDNIIALGRQYYQQHGTCYWCDLPSLEKSENQRYIGATGPMEWIASFSPAGTNEVIGILPHRSHFVEMDEKDVQGLAQGLVNVLCAYADMGISTFNFSLYSGPLDDRDDTFRCFIRIISRQNVYENYRTDDYFLQKLLDNELILTPPEILADNLKKHFNA